VEEIQCAVTRELNNISKTAFLEGMKKLKDRANVLIKEECILKNKNKSCPYKKLSLFYNSCLKTFGSHLVHILPNLYLIAYDMLLYLLSIIVFNILYTSVSYFSGILHLTLYI